MMKDNDKEKELLNYVPVYVLLPLSGLVAKNTKDAELETTKRKLKRLKKEAHIDGVMVDVWWGIVESEAPEDYYWDGYYDLFELIKSLGLKIYAIMSFHNENTKNIDLPKWVDDVGQVIPDIYYTDYEGNQNKECLSLGVDDKPFFGVGDGRKRTAIQIYKDFMMDFKNTMKKFLDAGVIVAIQVGLGPSGELRYPSFRTDPNCPDDDQKWKYPGIGEFQCFDKYLKDDFNIEAKKKGYRNLDLLKGEFGSYKSKPDQTTFFVKDGTYTKPEGIFFLEWYSWKLILHGDKILREANAIFAGLKVDLVAKVSGVHWWYNYCSHAAELTAGYYNLCERDGYRPIARMLYKRNCFLNFSCLEMENPIPEDDDASSAPHDLVKAVLNEAWKEGIEVIGGNTSEIKDAKGYNQVLFNARPNGVYDRNKTKFIKVHSFIYLRLSETIFKDNYHMFTKFVKKMHADQDYCGDAEKYPLEVDSDSELIDDEIMDTTKSSESFKWDSETIMKVDG